MLNTSPDSSRINSSFENGVATHFCSGIIFAISLKPFIGMMQMTYRWKKYRPGSPSICRTLGLIRYGFERNLAAKKRAHSVFRFRIL